MAYNQPGFRFSLVALDAINTGANNQFGNLAVDVNAAGLGVLPAAAGRIVGVTPDPCIAGEVMSVVQSGIVNIWAGDAVTAGSNVEVDAAGMVLDEVAGIVIGVALEDAAAGELATILLI